MSDITRHTVLEAFIKYKELSWTDFSTKEIFLNVYGGTDRAYELEEILDELENERLIEYKQDGTWCILEKGQNELKRQNEEIRKEREKKEYDYQKAKHDYWKAKYFWPLTFISFILGIVAKEAEQLLQYRASQPTTQLKQSSPPQNNISSEHGVALKDTGYTHTQKKSSKNF